MLVTGDIAVATSSRRYYLDQNDDDRHLGDGRHDDRRITATLCHSRYVATSYNTHEILQDDNSLHVYRECSSIVVNSGTKGSHTAVGMIRGYNRILECEKVRNSA